VNTFRWYLELTALSNLDSLDRLVSRSLFDVLNLLHNVVTLKHLSEDDMAAIQPASDGGSNEELASVCVLSCVGHAEKTLAGVLELEVLVGELFTVDGLAAGA
jgi:hypothetical protein